MLKRNKSLATLLSLQPTLDTSCKRRKCLSQGHKQEPIVATKSETKVKDGDQTTETNLSE